MGNLPRRICERDIHKLFRKFGRIRSVDLTTPRRKAPFAVIQFEGMRCCATEFSAGVSHACFLQMAVVATRPSATAMDTT